MIPPEGVKRKLNEVVDGIPPDEGYEILGGESTDDEWDSDEGENESEDETNDTEQLSNTQMTDNIADNEYASVDPEVEADLACLSRIESVVSMEKKESSGNLLPFFIKIENALCKKRQMPRQKKERRSNKLKWHPKVTTLIEVAVTENLMIITYLTFSMSGYYLLLIF